MNAHDAERADEAVLLLRELVIGVRAVRRAMGAGIAVASLVLAGLAIIFIAARGPLRQLDQLTAFNNQLTTATCDSTFYSAEERARRTEQQRRRLEYICQRHVIGEIK